MLIGIEHEVTFVPTVKQLRSISKELDLKIEQSNQSAAADYVNFQIFKNYDNWIFKPVSIDAGGLEFHYLGSYNDYVNKMSLYEQHFNNLAQLGYSGEFYRAGIHVNINITDLGNNKEEISNNLEKFIIWLYHNHDNEQLLKIFNRPALADYQSDLRWIVEDYNGNLSEKEFKRRIKYSKYQLIDALTHEKPVLGFPLNISIYKKNRPLLEWRWFASTLEASRLLKIVEFSHDLFTHIKNNSLLKIEDFKYG